MINAGGDVTLAGSQVKGKRVELDAENLNIESLQDKSRYHGKQMNVSGSVTVGYGFAAGGSFNKSKVNTDYASVNEQAGIFAGNDGYDINVKNKVSSVGGAILSSAPKEKNQMTAQDFEYSNIENYSNAKSSAMGLMGGFSVDRDQTSDEDKALNKIYRGEDRKGETFEQANPNKANQLPVKFGLGTNDVHSTDLYAAAKIGLANLASNSSLSENNQSTTNAVISDGNFNIASMQGKQNIEAIKKSTEQEVNKLEKVDHAELQKEVEQDVATIQNFAKNVGGATDEAYRTQFIAEHRLMTFELDENGNPIKDPEQEKDLVKKAKEEYQERKPENQSEEEFVNNYVKENPLGMNIYKLREVSDQERTKLKETTFFNQETKSEKKGVAVMFNGIFNNLQAAGKYATQNYIVDKDGKKIYQNLYFVHNPEARNVLSELIVAFYQKNMEGTIGGLGNSTIQAKNLMSQYGKQKLYIGAHSRGTLTVDNALNALDNKNNEGLLSGTTMKMVGPAANVEKADGRLARLQGLSEGRVGSKGSIIIENSRYDGVGRIVGGNSYTNEDSKSSLMKMGLDTFFGDTSPHNCSGIGNVQCVKDGYRRDWEMNLERRVYDLNRTNIKE